MTEGSQSQAKATGMNDSTKRASAIVFTLLVLGAVGMMVMLAVNQVAEGNLSVRDGPDGNLTLRRLLVHDVTHAGQYLRPSEPKDWNAAHRDFSRLPVTYWHPQGPVGKVLQRYNWFPGMENTWRADARLPASLIALGLSHGPFPAGQLVAAWSEPPLAAIPLKAGAVAAYARPFQIVDFYEPTPGIHELSFPKMGEAKFTFVRDALERGAGVRVFQGKERELLAKQAPRRFYHAIFVDTVRGDLADLADDLLTREGMAVLMDTTTRHGVVAFHVSNTRYDVVPVIADVAQSLKFACVLAEDRGGQGKGHYTSEWIVVARNLEYLRHLNQTVRHIRWAVPKLERPGLHVWTDVGPHARTTLERPSK